jgi:hypothetical protein
MKAKGILNPLFLTLLLITAPITSLAASGMEGLLPLLSCSSGWIVVGKPKFYDTETLSERINGEAELYFPYGFDRMSAARYAAEKNPASGMDVEIYRLGTSLDAYGMYANYRQKDGRSAGAGTESNLSGSQLFLYQGRHFVHIQATGSDAPDVGALAECGRAVASRLPGTNRRPPELAVFDRPEIVKGTERYLPQSLLGYDFLNRGLMADTVVDGANLQLFLLLGATPESASVAFEGYRAQLGQGKTGAAVTSATLLEGTDPLYGPVMVLKKGTCVAGALKFSGKKGLPAVLESLCR